MKEKFVYINVILFTRGRTPEWFPCFDARYLGSSSQHQAVKLRKEFFAQLPKDIWVKEQFKTIKVSLIKNL